ncbi:MAG: efflux RND transporter periplasmic adaptor subunit [Proteobacteria bacterium]|nr:efflux RND transporter periplasmic adaptor subunit [Pseudomonadota bacterium]
MQASPELRTPVPTQRKFLTRGRVITVVVLALVLSFAWGLKQRFSFFVPPKMPTPVEAVTVAPEKITEVINAVGTLSSYQSVTIRPEVEGRITNIYFTEGARVAAGSALLDIDDSVYKAEVNEREATYKLNQLNNERAENLSKRGAGSLQARDEARAKLKTSEAALESSKVKLEKTKITAPFNGIIGIHDVSVGDFVKVGEDITHLESIDIVRVTFNVPEKYLSKLQPSQRLTVKVDAFPNIDFSGIIYAIDPRIDPNTRNIAVKAEILNTEQKMRPGMFAYVTLKLDERVALLLPESALIPKGNDVSVMKVVNGKTVPAPVKAGMRKDGKVEILEGLTPGDVVITAGYMKTPPGADVIVKAPEGSAPASPAAPVAAPAVAPAAAPATTSPASVKPATAPAAPPKAGIR